MKKTETAMLKGPTNSHHGSPIICHPHLPWLKCTENFALTFEKNILGKKLLSLFGVSSIGYPICHDLNIMFTNLFVAVYFKSGDTDSRFYSRHHLDHKHQSLYHL
jgi:hypothetical protein